jgi:hypothetical protein
MSLLLNENNSGEEAYREWLKQPPIQFPLRPESPIQNLYSNTSSSHVGDEGNDIEVGMDDFLWDTQAMEGMLLDAFQQNELGDDVDVIDTFFESLKSASTTPLFGRVQGSRSTQLGTTMLLYNLKAMYGMSDMCFSTLLR